MALQNLPEGYAVAVALLAVGHSSGRAFLVALLTGLVEPVGSLLGVAAVTLSEALLPVGMGFAAGAMLFVISGEIIPESHREGQGLAGTVGVLVGFVVMMLLDTAFG
jgi:ZIP family zinc transporter